jgi:hypothetical protein
MKKPLTAALLGLAIGMTNCQSLQSSPMKQETDRSEGQSPLFRFVTTAKGDRVIWPVKVALPKNWQDQKSEVGRYEELVKKQTESGQKEKGKFKITNSVALRASNRLTFEENRIASIQILRLKGRMNIGEGAITFSIKLTVILTVMGIIRLND